MAKRPNLAAVDLKDSTKEKLEASRNSVAQTMRLPPEYWDRVKKAAAAYRTSQLEIVKLALDGWFALHRDEIIRRNSEF
jgi:hypothetical protein